jgi:hypothetical protein
MAALHHFPSNGQSDDSGTHDKNFSLIQQHFYPLNVSKYNSLAEYRVGGGITSAVLPVE